MTGTAAVTFRLAGVHFQIWARSVNHRFFELQLRCPRVIENAAGLYQTLEDRLRAHFHRGRIEFEISADDEVAGLRRLRFNRQLAQEYLQVVGEFMEPGAGGAGPKKRRRKTAAAFQPGPAEVFALMQLPGVVELEQSLPADFDRARFLREFDRAIGQLQKSRQKEGAAIGKVLRGYLREIEIANRKIQKRQVLYKKEKLASIRRDLNLSGDSGPDPLKSAVDWLDKGDISEELERVHMHVAAMRALIGGKAPDPGKQIEFYSQELLRETNTIAAKSRDFDIRKLVVEMKTRIENIKEQIRNVS